MTSYNTYPNLPSWGHAAEGGALPAEGPSAPPEAPQVGYHLSVIKAKRRGLKDKECLRKNTRSTIKY